MTSIIAIGLTAAVAVFAAGFFFGARYGYNRAWRSEAFKENLDYAYRLGLKDERNATPRRFIGNIG